MDEPTTVPEVEEGADEGAAAPKEQRFEGWPAALALESLPGSAQEALLSLKEDVSALRDLAVALPVRLKRVARLKLLRKTSSARRIATIAGAFLVAGLFGIVVVSLAAAMALYGMAGAVAALLDVPLWGGMAITGSGVLIAAMTSMAIGWRRYAESRRATIRKAIDGIASGHHHTHGPAAP